MRTMDDVRFLPGKDDEVDSLEIVRDRVIEWTCSKCGKVNHVLSQDLEGFIESEERDPDIEYLCCYNCNRGEGITNGFVPVKLYDKDSVSSYQEGRIESDGTFVYFIGKQKMRLL